MGLIREVNEISYTMNKQAREREQRQRQKIELENYINEIKSNLQSEFYKYYNKDSKNAYKTILINKDIIVDKLTNYIENLTHYDKKTEKYHYLYKNKYDIVQDLQNNYFKELSKVKKEFDEIEKIEKQEQKEKEKDFENILYNELESYFTECNATKTQIYKCLLKNDYKTRIIDKITSDNQIKSILKQKYYTILAQVVKSFKIEIDTEKQEQKERIKQEREKERYKFAKYLIFTREFSKFSKRL